MTPAMTKEQALEAARELWGDRAQVCQLGKSYFLGVQKSKHEYDWRGWGGSWEEALNVARGDADKRKAAGSKLKERFARIPIRIDGDTITREWHGKEYVVKVLPDGAGFEFAGATHGSLTKIAKIITGAASISGPRFFGVDAKGGA
jgi:Protein of unknown function (DUF2924)